MPPSEQYSEIDIKAGYQRLCGKNALAYVRYRHTDTDLVRSARQQDFLREARQRVPISTLVGDYQKLIKIFTSYTTSDVSDAGQFLEVLKLFFDARGASIKEVHFPAVLGPSYVYASKPAIQPGRRPVPRHRGQRRAARLPRTPKKERTKKKRRSAEDQGQAPGGDGLVPAADSGRAARRETVARKVSAGFPVFYPTRLPSGAYFVASNSYEHIQNPRAYHLRDTGGKIHGAYRMTLQLPPLGDYFGIQGIAAGAIRRSSASPSETKTIAGRDYSVYLDGDRVRLVAWHAGENTYWVANSLLQTLSNDQMIGIARSAEFIRRSPSTATRGRGDERARSRSG